LLRKSSNHSLYSAEDRKKIPTRILGITKQDEAGDYQFLCRFKDGRFEKVPRPEANELVPEMVIKYYESRIVWATNPEDPAENVDMEQD
jgi:hypothetical protein